MFHLTWLKNITVNYFKNIKYLIRYLRLHLYVLLNYLITDQLVEIFLEKNLYFFFFIYNNINCKIYLTFLLYTEYRKEKKEKKKGVIISSNAGNSSLEIIKYEMHDCDL